LLEYVYSNIQYGYREWNIIIPPTSANEQQGVVQVSAPHGEQTDRFWNDMDWLRSGISYVQHGD